MNEVKCLNYCHDHRCQPHQKLRKLLRNCPKSSLWNNYLKLNSLLGKDFSLMFHISHSRFEKLMKDIMGISIPFISDMFGRNGKLAASLVVHLFMLIKTLLYGVPLHTFFDHFQNVIRVWQKGMQGAWCSNQTVLQG